MIVKNNGSRLSLGINRDKNDPITLNNSGVSVFPSQASVHAEIAAIKQLKRIPKRATIYIARINKAGKPMLSKPCSECQKVLDRVGIKKVIYT